MAVFLVEIDGQNESNKSDSHTSKDADQITEKPEPPKEEDLVVESSNKDLSQIIIKNNDAIVNADSDNAKSQIKTLIFAPVFKTPACLCMMVYAFFTMVA